MTPCRSLSQTCPEEIQARIFEPFFTTREVGEGSGLGLAIADAIVRGAGGSIRVDSAPGKGAVFRIELPSVPVVDKPFDLGALRALLEDRVR